MAETFQNYQGGISAPAFDGAAVVADTAFILTSRGIWVGGAGDVSVVLQSGNTVVLKGVLAGSLLPVRATKVTSTNTTASNMVALF